MAKGADKKEEEKLPQAPPLIEGAVKFNPDKSVDYTTGGKTFKLSPEEYANVLKSTGAAQNLPAAASPATKEILGFEKMSQQDRLLRQELAKGVPAEQIPEISAQPGITPEIPKEKGAVEQFLKTRFFQPVGFSGISATEEFLKNPQKEFGRAIDETIIGAGIGLGGAALLSRGTSISTALKGISLKRLATGAGALGITKLTLITNQNILSKALSHLEQINRDVAAGNITYEAAANQYDVFYQQIISAYSATKWINSSDVLKFLAGGKDTETAFLTAVEYDYPRLRRGLDIAAQTATINEAKLMAGIR